MPLWHYNTMEIYTVIDMEFAEVYSFTNKNLLIEFLKNRFPSTDDFTDDEYKEFLDGNYDMPINSNISYSEYIFISKTIANFP